jgi:hypothetical protein
VITWFGYRCERCKESFVLFNRYEAHVTKHIMAEEGAWWDSIVDACCRVFEEQQTILQRLWRKYG